MPLNRQRVSEQTAASMRSAGRAATVLLDQAKATCYPSPSLMFRAIGLSLVGVTLVLLVTLAGGAIGAGIGGVFGLIASSWQPIEIGAVVVGVIGAFVALAVLYDTGYEDIKSSSSARSERDNDGQQVGFDIIHLISASLTILGGGSAGLILGLLVPLGMGSLGWGGVGCLLAVSGIACCRKGLLVDTNLKPILVEGDLQVKEATGSLLERIAHLTSYEDQMRRDRAQNLRPYLKTIIDRDGSNCSLTWGKGCGQPLSFHPGDAHVDHIVPLSRFYELRRENRVLSEIVARPDLHGAHSLRELEGANDLRNLAALCASCNASAGNRTPVELGRRRKRERSKWR